MTLAAGSKLGPYEILSPLGAGGMGEVYKARDTRLERTVAVKVLPADLATTAGMRQRFEREAKAISQLSHPNICALYDVGHQDGVEYLVMEYLEGQTLSDRLARGPLPLDQTLRYGMQIADALDRAHRHGIVHRDLKPGNVMLTNSGVKLLDFGLVKLVEPAAPVSGVTALPTVAGPPELTQEGTILGTFQYMAPEQLEGHEADSRTDIFALGAVLYEMATGRKAFEGRSQASLIGAILRDEPGPISAVAPLAPPALDRVVSTCLAKDPEDRWQSARDLRTELAWIAERRSSEPVEGSTPPPARSREQIAWILAAAGAVAVLLLLALRPPTAPPPGVPQKFSVLAPAGASFALQEAPKISPDGRTLAFVAIDAAGRAQLYVRPLASLTSRPLPETDGASMPFWSPDGRSLGFFASGKLKTVRIDEGRPQVLADAPVGRGGSWSRDGSIIFVPGPPDPPYVVSASGGTARPLFSLKPTVFDAPRHFFPDFLPDGRHYIALSILRGTRSTVVSSLDGRTTDLLSGAWSPAFAAPGYLLFRREGTLMARRFDSKRLKLDGEPFVVASDVGFNPITWQALFSASSNGILAYHGSAGARTQLTWVDREGKPIKLVGSPGIYNSISLSPDGKRVAYDQADPRTGDVAIWSMDTEKGTATRLTFSSKIEFFPVWSADGSRVIYCSLKGPPQLYQKLINGAGDEEPLLESNQAKIPTSISPDGRFLVYAVLDPRTRFDLWVLPLFGDRRPFPYLRSEATELGGQISPNGRWMAYSSNESGAYEVYVRPFPLAAGKWQVSRQGGTQPRWRADGKELFYLSTDRVVMSVPIRTDLPAFEAGTPQTLFEGRVSGVEGSNPWAQYAASGDGQRFLVNRVAADTASSSVTVIVNWPALEGKDAGGAR